MLLPIHSVVKPSILAGAVNGRLSAALLIDIPGQDGGPVVRLVRPAANGWRALCAAARAVGFVLVATSVADSYRLYEIQERIFLQRYTTTPNGSTNTRTWQGKTWYLRPGFASAAAPGTSNHGLGLAIDTALRIGGKTVSLTPAALAWLVANAGKYGFSWEIQSENWHIRYYVGDVVPAAITAYLKGESDMTPRELLDTVITADSMKIRYEDWANRVLVRLPTDLKARLDALAASAAADATRDAAMLAAINAMASHSGADPAPIIAAIKDEAERTRAEVTELRAALAASESELDTVRGVLHAAFDVAKQIGRALHIVDDDPVLTPVTGTPSG